MKKFNNILLSIVLVSTAITLYITYRNIDPPFAYPFVGGYVIFLLAYGLYLIIIVMLRLFKMDKKEFRSRLVRFIRTFLVLSVLGLILNLTVKSHEPWYSFFGTALGIAIGVAFIDLAFYKEKS